MNRPRTRLAAARRGFWPWLIAGAIGLAAVGGALAFILRSAPPTSAVTDAVTAGSAGQQIAFVKDGGAQGDTVWIVNSDGSGARVLADGVGTVGDIAWSKDGSRLAILSGPPGKRSSVRYDRLRVLNADGSGLRNIEIGFSADIPTTGNSGVFINGIDWSSDGDSLAMSAYVSDNRFSATYDSGVSGPAIFLCDVASGMATTLLLTRSPDGGFQGISSSPDANTLLVGLMGDDHLGHLNAIDVASPEDWGKALSIDNPPEQPDENSAYNNMENSNGAYSPDGGRVACVRVGFSMDFAQRTPLFLVVAASDGSGAQVVFQSDEMLFSPSWAPNGQALVFSRGPADRSVSPTSGQGDWLADQRVSALSLAQGAGPPVDIARGFFPAWRPIAALGQTTTTQFDAISVGEVNQLSAAFLEARGETVQVFDCKSLGDWAAAWVGSNIGSLQVFHREDGRWVVVQGKTREGVEIQGFARATSRPVAEVVQELMSAGLPQDLSQWIASTQYSGE